MTVTVYHTTFNPFECRRAVLEGVHYETRRTVAVDKTGAAHRAGYLLIIPQKTAARVSQRLRRDDRNLGGTEILARAAVPCGGRGMKCRVTVDIPDGEGWVEALGLGRDGPVQQFHTANVLRRIQKYMPYRTGATIKLTICLLYTYDGYDILGSCQVDYTDQIPNQGFVFPQGLVEVERREDILGNVTLTDRYNFGLYFTFEKALQDDTAARANASWVMDFQRWVQEQSARGLVPNFGNTETKATAQAQNGTLYSAEDSGTALYMAVLSVTFKRKIEN